MRTPGTRTCGGCRYWSEMIAQSIGGRDVEALCLGAGPASGKYTVSSQTCGEFAKNLAGAVDEPPNYGEKSRAAYEEMAARKHQNGKPVFAKDGTLLDEKGNRSIFDDVDE